MSIWPMHPICGHLSRDKFEYIWRNIHLTDVEVDLMVDEELAESETSNSANGTTEEEEEIIDADQADEAEEEQDESADIDERWYAKAAPIVDHMNKISQKICRHPGFCCAVDEQMKRFKGRSRDTHRMKNKPIKQGYKFYAICCTQSGYVYNCIPDGRGRRAPNGGSRPA